MNHSRLSCSAMILRITRHLVTWLISPAPLQVRRYFFLGMAPSNFNTQHLLNSIMSAQSQEARVLLALQVVGTSQKMNVTHVAKLYNVPRSTLRDRLRGKPQAAEVRNSNLKLTSSEEETIVQYVLDLDSRGFPPRIYRVKDMADLLLTTRGATPVSK